MKCWMYTLMAVALMCAWVSADPTGDKEDGADGKSTKEGSPSEVIQEIKKDLKELEEDVDKLEGGADEAHQEDFAHASPAHVATHGAVPHCNDNNCG